MKLKKWIQLGLVVVLLAPLTACGSQNSKKTTSSRPKPTKVVQTPTEDT